MESALLTLRCRIVQIIEIVDKVCSMLYRKDSRGRNSSDVILIQRLRNIRLAFSFCILLV
jgi:hypothetical protein